MSHKVAVSITQKLVPDYLVEAMSQRELILDNMMKLLFISGKRAFIFAENVEHLHFMYRF